MKKINGKSQDQRVRDLMRDMHKQLSNPTRIAIYDLNRKHHVNNAVTKLLLKNGYLVKDNIYGKSNTYTWTGNRLPSILDARNVIILTNKMTKDYVESRKKLGKVGETVKEILDIVDGKKPPFKLEKKPVESICRASTLARDYEMKIFELHERITKDTALIKVYEEFVGQLRQIK